MKCVKKNLAIYQGILRRTTLALPPRIAQHGITRTSENADLHLNDSCSIIVGFKGI